MNDAGKIGGVWLAAFKAWYILLCVSEYFYPTQKGKK